MGDIFGEENDEIGFDKLEELLERFNEGKNIFFSNPKEFEKGKEEK
jgi:hypothetical protein